MSTRDIERRKMRKQRFSKRKIERYLARSFNSGFTYTHGPGSASYTHISLENLIRELLYSGQLSIVWSMKEVDVNFRMVVKELIEIIDHEIVHVFEPFDYLNEKLATTFAVAGRVSRLHTPLVPRSRVRYGTWICERHGVERFDRESERWPCPIFSEAKV